MHLYTFGYITYIIFENWFTNDNATWLADPKDTERLICIIEE